MEVLAWTSARAFPRPVVLRAQERITQYRNACREPLDSLPSVKWSCRQRREGIRIESSVIRDRLRGNIETATGFEDCFRTLYAEAAGSH
jgi:hypothetical protein